MIVTCPRCLTKFNLPEEKMVSGARLQLHCSRCAWDFIFSPLAEEIEPPVESESVITIGGGRDRGRI